MTSDLKDKLIESISGEIKAIASDRSKLIRVDSGRLVDETQEGFLYTFKAEMRTNIPPESPIFFYQVHSSRLNGTLISQNDFDILICLKENIGETISEAKLSVDLTFILKSLSERLSEKKDPSLVDDLLSDRPHEAKYDAHILEQSFANLGTRGFNRNTSQEAAIRNCLSKKVHFVWGPPGTGKTTNLAQLAKVIVDQSEKLLVISHANAAVDAATLKIATIFRGSHLFRDGRILRIGVPQLHEVRRIEEISALGALKVHYPDLLERLEELESERARIAGEYSKGTRDKFLGSRLDEIRSELTNLRQKVREAETTLISDASIILATASKFAIDERIWKFGRSNIVIDETSMMAFPFVYAAAKQAEKRLNLFGDFRQLPPVCISEDPLVLDWLGRDAFNIVGIQHNVDNDIPDNRVTLLDTQYRMHDSIGQVVSHFAYSGKLSTDPKSSASVSSLAKADPCKGSAITLVDTSSLGTACMKENRIDSYSRVNPLHAVISLDLARQLIESGIEDIAIITPYKAQARLTAGLSKSFSLGKKISVATIHRFQGSEKEGVIFDLVDSLPQWRASRLTGSEPEVSRRLINVAISRCKGKLLVLADKTFLDHYHSARSPAVKLMQLMNNCPCVAFDGSNFENKEILWYENWSTAQVHVFRFLNSAVSIKANVPQHFTTGVQVKRLLEQRMSESQKPEIYGKARLEQEPYLYITSDDKLVLGGREAESPILIISGSTQEELRRAIIENSHSPSRR